MLGYVEGFFCHYALDRSVHPFVYYWQEKLRQAEPDYGKKGNAYHFRIESALDTIALRRETGRLIRDFRLKTVLPEDADGLYAAVGRLLPADFRSSAWPAGRGSGPHRPGSRGYAAGGGADDRSFPYAAAAAAAG